MPVEIPSISELKLILAAADRLANHKYKYMSQPWERYRAMIYLASYLRFAPAGIPRSPDR